MADFRDPFDDPFETEADQSPRKGGRPRTRQVKDKGPMGRPRIRPLEQKHNRKKGRPALNAGSVADRIEKEAIVSGSIGSKAVLSSMKGFDKSVALLQKGVVAPLAKSVSSFSKSVNDFNRYHQQYLKDQIAVTREFHETFKLFRKASIDPLIRTMARAQKGTAALSDVMQEVYGSGQYGKNYQMMSRQMRDFDKRLEKTIKTSVVGVEMTDTFLKEYYKTSKGTSKFLNAVAFATEDIAEDIESLKNDLNKYFKGSQNKSVLIDQSETLKRIEKNTAAPTVGKRIMSSVLSGTVAMAKTMFRYNRYGTTELLGQLTKMKIPSVKDLTKGDGPLSKILKVFDDAIAVQIREKVRDAQGTMRSTYQEFATGARGEFGAKVAEGIGSVGKGIQRVFISNLQQMGSNLVAGWNRQETKQRAKWFWEVAKTMGFNWYNAQGAIGERQINSVITNYGRTNYQGPHGGTSKISTPEQFVQKVMRDIGNYQPNDEPFGFNEAQPIPYLYSPISKSTSTIHKSVFSQGVNKADNKSNVVVGPWGTSKSDSGVVALDPKSESTIGSANISTPQKAFASLAKIQGRMLGYIEKLWKKVKGGPKEEVDKSEGGILGKLGALLGAGGLGALLLKNRKFLRGKNGALSAAGKAVFGAHALKKGFQGKVSTKWAKVGGLGATARVLWDTFGWGNAAKGGTQALAAFKNTKLGQSALGTFIRKARLASAGIGTDVGSRLLGGAIHSGKWGGGPLGALAGAWHGLGLKFTKNADQLIPRLTLSGRKAAPKLGGVATTAGYRTAQLAKKAKEAKFIQANPKIAEKLGTGKVGRAVAGVKNVAVGIGSALAKIPSKDRFLGGVLKAAGGGAALKAIGKMGGKGVAKALAKQIPILGAIVGIGFGINRFTKGDVLGGILEIVSGLLTLVPSGAGNAAALGIDAFLIGRDIKKHKEGKSPINDKDKKKILETFGVKGQGSKDNYVSQAQSSSGSTPTPGGDDATQSTPSNKQGFFAKMGAAIKRGAQITAGYASGTAGGEKITETKDVGAINWNGKKHDQFLPDFRKKFFSAAADFNKQTGKKVHVTSAIRTDEEQARLWYRANVLKDPNVMMPAKPAGDHNIDGYLVKGTGQNTRTGHLVGGAVDVANWREFKPFAEKYGLRWMGSKDPVHFQVDTKAPVISSAKGVSTYKPPAASGNSNKVGDGAQSTYSPLQSTNSGGGASISSPSSETVISPMIQDYGLAIVNNLIFA